MLRIFKQYYPIRNIFFFIGEGIAIFTAVIMACWLILNIGLFGLGRWLFLKIFLIASICQICLYYNDLYDLKVIDNFQELGIRLLQALGASAIILAGIYVVFPKAIVGNGVFAISIAFIILLIVSWRFFYTLILNHGIFDQKIILLGSGRLAQNILNEIIDRKDSGYTVAVNILDAVENQDALRDQLSTKIICKKDYDGLCDLAEQLNIKKVVVAIKERRGTLPLKELVKCRVKGIDVIEGTSFYEMLAGKLIVDHINPAWIIFSKGFYKSPAKRFLKRSTDLIAAMTLLILFLPLILITAILIKIDSEGPVLFYQERVGKNKKPYQLFKFRSMVQNAEAQSGPVWASDNDDRITRVGKIIRKWRIDELPQLWNVLKGDMSFVGPRPEREFFVNKLENVIPFYGERFSVKPGITGWAQVCYRYGASVEDALEKVNYDLFYIKNMSVFMDLMIILRTIKIVLFGTGAR